MPASRRNPARDTLFVAAFRAGSTLKAIGREHGITRERVRQILAPLLTRAERHAIRVARVARRQAQRDADRQRPYLERPVPCAMCHATILRGKPWEKQHPTCSHRCYRTFLDARRYVSPELAEAHRRAAALTWLRKPEKYGAVRVRYATRVLAGEARRRGPNRHPKDSRARQVAREFGFLPAEEKGLDTGV